jgi:hypothetical protein
MPTAATKAMSAMSSFLFFISSPFFSGANRTKKTAAAQKAAAAVFPRQENAP